MAKVKVPVNHIALVVDRSGSMRRIMKNVVKVFNQQLATIKANAKKGQDTFISFYTFHNRVDAPIFKSRKASLVKPLKKIELGGATALFDAVGTAITDLGKVKGAKDAHVSFLVITLTDGAENASRTFKKKLPGMIKQVQKTGRWSLVFLTPKDGVKTLTNFGIPAGNIQDWAATSQGTKSLSKTMTAGLNKFFTARKEGKQAVSGFFKADLRGVSTDAVSSRLADATKEFKKWPVANNAGIRDFVNSKLSGGAKYETGHGYYELTKPELVQAKKEIGIMDKKSGKIFTGQAARSMLGFPDGSSFKVKPGEMGNFSVFVMSTSNNRVLMKGTTLLYRN